MSLAALACGGSGSEAPVAARKPLASGGVVGNSGPNLPPQVTNVALSSRDVVMGVPLEARYEASDPNGDPLSFEIVWLRNGDEVQRGDQRSWTPHRVEKGDRIELRVIARDGALASAPGVATARVGNRPPEISNVLLEPHEAPKRGETLTATAVVSDADGDDAKLSYEWLVNGEIVFGARDRRFELAQVQRGDRIRVRVRARDAEDESAPAHSAELVVANAPPVFEKFSGFDIEGGVFRHQFHATDPDGDKALRFALAEGPRGMEIDPLLGIASWRPDGSETGKIPVQIEVQDAYGASSALRFELTLSRPGEPLATEAASPAKAEEG